MTDPGKMRHRIIFQKNVSEKDARGSAGGEWQDWYTCFAAANDLYGSEYYEARQAGVEESVKLTVRCSAALKSVSRECYGDYRVIFDGRAYSIAHIDNVQYRDNMLIITAERREGENYGQL